MLVENLTLYFFIKNIMNCNSFSSYNFFPQTHKNAQIWHLVTNDNSLLSVLAVRPIVFMDSTQSHILSADAPCEKNKAESARKVLKWSAMDCQKVDEN